MRFVARFLIFLLVVFSTACRTYVAVPNAAWSALESGDEVRVTTREGAQHEFAVESADTGILRGASVELDFGEIAVIERSELVPSTPQLVLVAVLAALVFLYIASEPLAFDS